MQRIPLFAVVLAVFASPSSLACGESRFSMGQGLEFQGYLTPRPAAVLVFDDHPEQRREVYAGLHRVGHRLTVVETADDLNEALGAGSYDVLISDLSQVGLVSPTDGQPRILPVVQRTQRQAPELGDAFDVYLLDDASLGQYLKGIDRLVKGSRP